MGKILKSDLRRAIQAHGGNITKVAEHFNVSRQTIYNYVGKKKLWDEVDHYRKMMFRMAEDNLFGAVEDGDTEVAKFIVRHFPGGGRWSSKQEISVGAVHLSDETLTLLDKMGVDVEDAGEQFERIVREMAEARMVNESR